MTDPTTNSSPTVLAEDAAFTGASIDRLRKLRCRPERNLAIHAMVDQCRREASKSRRGIGDFVDAWESVVPARSPRIHESAEFGGASPGSGWSMPRPVTRSTSNFEVECSPSSDSPSGGRCGE